MVGEFDMLAIRSRALDIGLNPPMPWTSLTKQASFACFSATMWDSYIVLPLVTEFVWCARSIVRSKTLISRDRIHQNLGTFELGMAGPPTSSSAGLLDC